MSHPDITITVSGVDVFALRLFIYGGALYALFGIMDTLRWWLKDNDK